MIQKGHKVLLKKVKNFMDKNQDPDDKAWNMRKKPNLHFVINELFLPKGPSN